MSKLLAIKKKGGDEKIRRDGIFVVVLFLKLITVVIVGALCVPPQAVNPAL